MTYQPKDPQAHIKALNLALQHKQKQRDYDMNSGTVGTSAGVPTKQPSDLFGKVGATQGSFGEAVAENTPYFRNWMAQFQQGRQMSQPSNSSPA